MTSQRKITTNRSNALRSRGPRTTDGKRRASRNSRKHGWAAALSGRLPAGGAEVEQLARAICGEQQDAAALAQARIIAENELIYRAIARHKHGLVERRLKPQGGDEYRALELAAPDLDALERYETRAWSRQMRAIREFIENQTIGRILRAR